MNSELVDEDENPVLPPTGPAMVDGRPTRSMMIVEQGSENVVLWQVDLAGHPCGAWVIPYLGAETAIKLLHMCDRRALIAVDPEGPVGLIQQWSSDSGVKIDIDLVRTRICLIQTLISETYKARGAYQEAVTRSVAKSVPLSWEQTLPNQIPGSFEELVRSLGVRISDGPNVSDRVRLLARLAEVGISFWINTEKVRNRRRYLVSEFGESKPLPASWCRATTWAYETSYLQ